MLALRAGPPQIVTFCAAHKKRQFASAHAAGFISLKDDMSNLRVKWMYGGALAIVLISSLILTVGVMNPFVPMPIYQVILAWIISIFSILVMPLIYLLEMKLISQSKHFSIIVTALITILALLNLKYFWGAWDYGLKYQGELHTQIVAIENVVGFSIALAISIWSLKNKNKNKNTVASYVANFILFALLSWCAFPYLGELP